MVPVTHQIVSERNALISTLDRRVSPMRERGRTFSSLRVFEPGEVVVGDSHFAVALVKEGDRRYRIEADETGGLGGIFAVEALGKNPAINLKTDVLGRIRAHYAAPSRRGLQRRAKK